LGERFRAVGASGPESERGERRKKLNCGAATSEKNVSGFATNSDGAARAGKLRSKTRAKSRLVANAA
jgi:hypothetical protein